MDGKVSLKSIDEGPKRLPAYAQGVQDGEDSQQRILWMATFVPGLEGRRGLPYVLVGDPGTVKTSRVRHLAKRAGLPFWSVLGSIRQPVDFMGCPVPQRMKLTNGSQHLSPNGDSELLYMHYAPAGFGVQAALHKDGIILFDEANNMPLAVQSAMLRVLFEGVVGELELPPGIRMFLATNEIQDAAGGHEISRAMATRMGWLEWEKPSVDQFGAYLASSRGRGQNGVEPIDFKAEELAVDERWDDAWGKSAMLIYGFLRARPALYHKKPKQVSERAWANPRTWDFACHALAGSFVYELSQAERQQAVAAYVGSAAYTEFYAYAQNADLPDPELLLDGKVAFEHNPARLDRTAAVLSGCTAKVLPEGDEKREERIKALWKIIKNLPESALDIAVPHVRQLAQANTFVGNVDAFKVLKTLGPIVDASSQAA